MTNLILAAASLVVIIVCLEVLSAMRPGVTCWLHFPTWLGIALAAFFMMLTDKPVAWYEVALVVSMAGMLWRHRTRLVWEVAHAKRGSIG